MPRHRTVDDDQILEAAVSAVGEVGPARLTLADVGSKVGLSPATLIQRFGSKRALLLALAAHGADSMPSTIRAASEAEQPVDALVNVLVEFATSVRSVAQFANHLSFLLMDLSDPEFQELSQRHSASVREAIATVLAAAGLPGKGVGLSTAELAGLVYSVYNGALITWGMDPRGRADEAVASRLRHFFDLLPS